MMAMAEEFSGSLSERVVLERWHSARDASGDDAGQWLTVEPLFAHVEPAGQPAPRAAGEAARSGRRWRVLLRRRADVDLAARLRWRGRILTVLAVDDGAPQRDLIELLCEAAPA